MKVMYFFILLIFFAILFSIHDIHLTTSIYSIVESVYTAFSNTENSSFCKHTRIYFFYCFPNKNLLFPLTLLANSSF